jgi:hypothetical protein
MKGRVQRTMLLSDSWDRASPDVPLRWGSIAVKRPEGVELTEDRRDLVPRGDPPVPLKD